MRTRVAYLLVYLAVGTQGDDWADIGNDPDFRERPFTWGICRTNVRGWAQPGDDLFFIAKRTAESVEDRYFLRGRFRVSERIDHVEARTRLGPRQNVIIDELPAGRDVRSGIADYVGHHRHELQWNDGRLDLSRLESGQWAETDLAVQTAAGWYVHSYWDPHVDWANRLRSPYLIADESVSSVLSDPLRWADIANRSDHLPSPGVLTNKSNRHAAQRVWHWSDIELLSNVFAGSATRTPSVGDSQTASGLITSELPTRTE